MNASVCTSQFLAKNFFEQIREICQKNSDLSGVSLRNWLAKRRPEVERERQHPL